MPPMPVFPGMPPQPQQPQGFMDRLFPQGGRGMDDPITMMLLQAGAGMLDNQGSFGQGLSSGLQGAAQGLAMGTQFQRQKKQGERQDQEWELQQQQLQSEQARAAKVAEIQAKTARGEQLTPGDLFTLDPGAFAKQQLEAQNPKKRDGFTLGNVRYEYDEAGKPQIVAQGQREQKDAPETWGPMTPEQAQSYGLQSPAGYRVSTRGQVQQIPGMGGSDEPMVEVYDPESPTGTSYVPRSQAPGRAGKPSNGITVGPDGTVQIGGSGAMKPPEGYRWSDPEKTKLEPITGGPKDPNSNTGITTDQRNKLAAARVAHANITTQMDRLAGAKGPDGKITGGLMNSPDAGYGASGATLMPSELNSQMDSAYNAMLMEIKNLVELGVLNGRDETLINQIVPPPTDWTSMVRSPKAAMDEARKYIDNKLASAEKIYGGGAPAAPPGSGNIYDEAARKAEEEARRKAASGGTSKEVDDLFMQFGM